MILRLEFQEFQRLLSEIGAAGFVFVKTQRNEDGTAIYDLYTDHRNWHITSQLIAKDEMEQINIQETYLKGFRVYEIKEIEDKDIVLNITKG